MRDRVLGVCWPFAPHESSCSGRRPKRFDWTDDPAEATVDTVVYFGQFERALESPGRKIAWLLESPAILRWGGQYQQLESDLDAFADAFEVILCSDRAWCARHPKFVYSPPGSNLPWLPEHRYALYRKYRDCSMFASAKTMVWGHCYRHEIAARLKDRLDLFGGAAGSPRIGSADTNDKLPGLAPYRFHVAVENAVVDDYYSEKLTDCFASGTVPVYRGSRCVETLFDPDGILWYDDGFDPAQLDEERYLAMLPAVRENHRLVRELESGDDALYRTWIETPRAVPVPATPVRVEPCRAFGAWPEVELPPPAPPSRAPEAELLARAKQPDRREVVLAEVPADRRISLAIDTRCEAPRGVRSFPPVAIPDSRTVDLLVIRDAFISDGVVHDDERVYSLGRWWMQSGSRPAVGAQRVERVDAAIAIGAWCGDFFQHFLMDALPQLAAIVELLDRPGFRHVKIATHVGGELDRFPAWFWDRVGLADRTIRKPFNSQDDVVIHANVALAVHFDPSPGSLGVYPRQVLAPLRGRGSIANAAPREHVLFLLRPHTRQFADQEALLERLRGTLRTRGIPLVEHLCGDDWDRDAALVSRARVIVSVHSGALANMVFAAPGTHVVEVVPYDELASTDQFQLRMFWGMAQAAGLHHWTVSPRSWEHRADVIDVDHEELVEAVCRALDESYRTIPAVDAGGRSEGTRFSPDPDDPG